MSAPSPTATTSTILTTTTSPPTLAASTGPGRAFAYAARPTTPFVAAEGSLTVTGDIQGTGRFSLGSCSDTRFAENVGFLTTLPYYGSGKVYYLDLAGFGVGHHTFGGAWVSAAAPPQRLRFSVANGDDFLDWGVSEAGVGQVSGDVITAMDGKASGSFELDLGFTGSDSSALGPLAHGPVHISGSWNCRPFVAGDGTLSVTGDFAMTARFSSSSCDETRPENSGTLRIRAEYQAPGGAATKRLVLGLVGVPAGESGYPSVGSDPAFLALRVETAPDSNDFLYWGRENLSDPQGAGTVTVADPGGKAGSFDLTLAFGGNDRKDVAPSAHGPIHVTGSWHCP